MLAEFLDRLVGLAKSAHRVDFHVHDRMPNTVFVRHGDELLEKPVPPVDRAHSIDGFDDLVAALLDESIAPNPEVYLHRTTVVALLNRDERRQRVTVPLVESDRFSLIRKLQEPQLMTPRAAVKLLRLDLHGGGVGSVIQSLSRVDFTRSSSGRSHVEHGKESLGRSVEQAVQQAKDVPEQFFVGVPLWKNQGFNRYGVNVEFGLYLDLDEERVELRVLSDEVDRAVGLALSSVRADLVERLEGRSVPVFLGRP